MNSRTFLSPRRALRMLRRNGFSAAGLRHGRTLQLLFHCLAERTRIQRAAGFQQLQSLGVQQHCSANAVRNLLGFQSLLEGCGEVFHFTDGAAFYSRSAATERVIENITQRLQEESIQSARIELEHTFLSNSLRSQTELIQMYRNLEELFRRLLLNIQTQLADQSLGELRTWNGCVARVV